MADDIQTVQMVTRYVPYERPSQPAALWTAIPRGLVTLVAPLQVLDAKALGDEAILELRATLPPNFAYVMNDANFTLNQNRAFDWGGDDPKQITLNLQNFLRGSSNVDAVQGNYPQLTVFPFKEPTTIVMIKDNPWPTSPLVAEQGTSGILINWTAFNDISTATLAGTFDAFMTFWQFDLEQIQKYPINSPTPVHTR